MREDRKTKDNMDYLSSDSSSDNDDDDLDEEDLIITKVFDDKNVFTAKSNVMVPWDLTFIDVVQLRMKDLKEMAT